MQHRLTGETCTAFTPPLFATHSSQHEESTSPYSVSACLLLFLSYRKSNSRAVKMTEVKLHPFNLLPAELQMQIMLWLDSHTLRAASVTSKHLRALILPVLFSKVKFSSLLPNETLVHFAQHCAPFYGHFCQELDLVFSFGPLLESEYDRQRSEAFATILRYTSQNLRKIVLDTAGSSLSDCATTIEMLKTYAFPSLQKLKMRCYDPEEQEIVILGNLLKAVAMKSDVMPSLQSLTLEGQLTLSPPSTSRGDIDTFPLCGGLCMLMASKSGLRELHLKSLDIRTKELHQLLTASVTLETLTLEKLDLLSLHDIFQSLAGTPLQDSLRTLTLHLEYPLIPWGHMRLLAGKQYTFLALKHLNITLNQDQRSTGFSDMSMFALYGSVFRCAQLFFPCLESVNLDKGFSFSPGGAKALAAHIMRAKKTTMPNLRELICASDAPADNLENVGLLLEKCGILVRRPPFARHTSDLADEREESAC